jgi:xylonate dehydratase
MSLQSIFGRENQSIYSIKTHGAGPKGSLPLTPEMLRELPSGDIFGMTQNAGMGWDPSRLLGKQVLIIGTLAGIRDHDGTPIALGYHTGNYELGLQMRAAAEEVTKLGGVPFASFVSDPCDGRSQGTTGMFDSLPYRNDAAVVMRRLIRSIPTRRAVVGVAINRV